MQGKKPKNLNKIYIHPKFRETIEDINKLNIKLPQHPVGEELDFRLYTFPPGGELVSNIEEIKKYTLNPKNGEKLIADSIILSAYDESINKFSALEGTAYMTAHSLVIHYNREYLPSNLLTFYFYTRSRMYTSASKLIKYSSDPETDSKKDYVNDRNSFILDYTPENSIIFIDGPLIGGQISGYTVDLNNKLLEKNIIPIFFVKNTSSNLVTDNVKELKGKFNSDMHWAYKFLKRGERTNFFRYIDKNNPKNAKIFCYLKPFNVSPQRIEFHNKTFEKYQDIIKDLIDLIYYLILVQGDIKNPQIRSIAIAEKYARDVLQLMDLTKIMMSTGIMPTINQERFAWG